MGHVKLCIIIKLEMFKYLCRKIFQSNQFCTKNKIHSLCDTGCLYSWQGMVYHSWCQIHQTLYILCLNRKNTKNHCTFFFLRLLCFYHWLWFYKLYYSRWWNSLSGKNNIIFWDRVQIPIHLINLLFKFLKVIL